MFKRSLNYRRISMLCLLLFACTVVVQPVDAAVEKSNATSRTTLTYTNPLKPVIAGTNGLTVDGCADPSIIHSRTAGDTAWYIYCTTDPLNDQDRTGPNFNFPLMPILKSFDLVNWTYVGNSFTTKPAWVRPDAGLWAPDVQYFNNKYYMYYTAPDTVAGGSAIGVATSDSPAGPWIDSGGPIVAPRLVPGSNPANYFWTFDAFVMEDNGERYIFYGSYFGGIFARKISADGLTSDPSTEVAIAIGNRYEGSYIYKHNGFFYLFMSATNCCNGPFTAYSVFAGRSANIMGPYVDREGNSILAGRVGGTPVISNGGLNQQYVDNCDPSQQLGCGGRMETTGQRWVGAGHNAVFTDFAGQDWFIYHAVDKLDPYYEGTNNFTRRPVLLDPLDWDNGWPTVRGGYWSSTTPMPAPVAQPGGKSRYVPQFKPMDKPGALMPSFSDEFDTANLSQAWSWVRQPANTSSYGLENGTFRFNTQGADIYEGSNNASVLVRNAPARGNYMVEAKVSFDIPAEGCCFNYRQVGFVLYKDDDNFIKLAHASIWETRQTEFAKEDTATTGSARYGNTVVGAPGAVTYLRIAVRRGFNNEEYYTGYTSTDGANWVRGGSFVHNLGTTPKIGLISLGGPDFIGNFDYIRTYELR